ncbi:hypothetical protein LJC23_01895 [Desulfovibrio sp. OttesenSCG-928-I05]|nr:hypothetical protein [Desulfovibrio sp. OttesenSCG-928-I05]
MKKAENGFASASDNDAAHTVHARFIVHLYIDPVTGWGEEDLSLRYPAVSGRITKGGSAEEPTQFAEGDDWQGLMSALSASGLASVEFSAASGNFAYTIRDSGARDEWLEMLKSNGAFEDSFMFAPPSGNGEEALFTASLVFINDHPAFSGDRYELLQNTSAHDVHITLNEAPSEPEEAEQDEDAWQGTPTDTEPEMPPVFAVDPFDPEGEIFGNASWGNAGGLYPPGEEYTMEELPDTGTYQAEKETPEIVLNDYYELQGEGQEDMPASPEERLALIEEFQMEGAAEDPGLKTLVIYDKGWGGMADLVRQTGKFRRVNDSPMRIHGLEGDYDHYTYTSGRGEAMHLYLEILCTQSA